MARIKYGFGISAISGKVGGCVFRSGKTVPVLQIKPSFLPAHSFAESVKKSYMGILNASWSQLSDSQRQVWASFTDYTPTRTVHSQDHFINGRQLFIKYNYYRLLYELPILEDPAFSTSTLDPVTFELSLQLGQIILTASRFASPVNEFFIASTTGVLRPTINNPGSRYRYMVFDTTATDTFNLTVPYFNKFGSIPVSGSTVFLKVTNVFKLFPVINTFQEIKTVL